MLKSSFQCDCKKKCRPKHPDYGFMPFLGVKKCGSEKGKIILEIKKIHKIPINGFNIYTRQKNKAKYDFHKSYSFIEYNIIFDFAQQERGNDFELFSLIFLQFRIIRCLQRKKYIFSPQIARQSWETDFDRSNITVELKSKEKGFIISYETL